MQEKPKEPFLSQNMIIAVIGAAATIIAATIPFVINNMNKAAPAAPTVTPIPPTEVPPTFTSTSLPPTEAFTPTPEPPTATVFVTETPVMRLEDVYLAIDPSGEVKATTFSSDQTIYVFYRIVDPTDQRKIKVVWKAVDVPGLDPNTVVYQVEESITKSEGSTSAGGFGTWKTGKYKVELYLNSALSSAQEFEIK